MRLRVVMKAYDLNTINQTKAELGYSPNSLNLTVFTGPGNSAALFSYWLIIFARTFYNLSFEQGVLLLIQRSKATNKLLKDKYYFIKNDDIQSIELKKDSHKFTNRLALGMFSPILLGFGLSGLFINQGQLLIVLLFLVTLVMSLIFIRFNLSRLPQDS